MMTPEDRAEVKQIVHKALGEHREDIDDRFNTMHLDMVSIRTEMNGLRRDFSNFTGKVTESTNRMSASLETIADNMGKLADLPDTWQKIKGFWAVMTWARDNWLLIMFILAVLLGGIYATMWSLGFRVIS